jgi:HAD superfamily hydrolase (TIGR01509 family)
VVFDMDGVLVDSEPLWARAEAMLLARHGDRFSPEDAVATHGRSIEASVELYASRLGGVEPAGLRVELIDLMRVQYAAGVALRPGAGALVRSLHGRVGLAVASNTDGELVRLALGQAGLLESFGVIVSGADLGRSKPDPAVYLAACDRLQVPPREAVAIEDSPAGVQAAKAAGLTCIGIPERAGVDLAGAGADVVVASLADLIPLARAPGRHGRTT